MSDLNEAVHHKHRQLIHPRFNFNRGVLWTDLLGSELSKLVRALQPSKLHIVIGEAETPIRGFWVII